MLAAALTDGDKRPTVTTKDLASKVKGLYNDRSDNNRGLQDNDRSGKDELSVNKKVGGLDDKRSDKDVGEQTNEQTNKQKNK